MDQTTEIIQQEEPSVPYLFPGVNKLEAGEFIQFQRIKQEPNCENTPVIFNHGKIVNILSYKENPTEDVDYFLTVQIYQQMPVTTKKRPFPTCFEFFETWEFVENVPLTSVSLTVPSYFIEFDTNIKDYLTDEVPNNCIKKGLVYYSWQLVEDVLNNQQFVDVVELGSSSKLVVERLPGFLLPAPPHEFNLAWIHFDANIEGIKDAVSEDDVSDFYRWIKHACFDEFVSPLSYSNRGNRSKNPKTWMFVIKGEVDAAKKLARTSTGRQKEVMRFEGALGETLKNLADIREMSEEHYPSAVAYHWWLNKKKETDKILSTVGRSENLDGSEEDSDEEEDVLPIVTVEEEEEDEIDGFIARDSEEDTDASSFSSSEESCGSSESSEEKEEDVFSLSDGEEGEFSE